MNGINMKQLKIRSNFQGIYLLIMLKNIEHLSLSPLDIIKSKYSKTDTFNLLDMLI